MSEPLLPTSTNPKPYNPPFWDEVKCYSRNTIPFVLPFILAVGLLVYFFAK